MTYAKFLVKFCIFIPISLSTIIIWDLLKNKSLLSQYIHWISFGTAGIMAGIFTGKLIKLMTSNIHELCLIKNWCAIIYENWLINTNRETKKSNRNKNMTKFQKNNIEESINLLTKTILKLYIRDWSLQLHNGQPLLMKQLETELKNILTELAKNLEKIDAKIFFKDVLILVGNRLSSLPKPATNIISGSRLTSDNVITSGLTRKCNNHAKIHIIEACIQTILEYFHIGNKLTCMAVYKILCQIITHQVVCKFIENTSNPRNLALLIYSTIFSEKTNQYNNNMKNFSDQQDEIITDELENEKNSEILEFIVNSKISSNLENNMEQGEQQALVRDDFDEKIVWKKQKATNTTMSREIEPPKRLFLPHRRLSLQHTNKISSALGGLFSSTAGPLLPDNMAFKPLNKIWKSSSTESFQDIPPNNATDGFDTTTSKSFLRRKYSLKAFQQGFKLHLSPSANLNISEDYKEILRKDEEKINGNDDDDERESIMEQQTSDDKDEEDLLPNYEDNSDLESTIQKLRQLLSERSHESVSTESNANNSISNGINMSVEEKLTIFNIKVDILDQQQVEDDQLVENENNIRLSISFDKQEYYGDDVNLITQRQIIKQWSNVIEFEGKLRNAESKIFDYGNDSTFLTEKSNQEMSTDQKVQYLEALLNMIIDNGEEHILMEFLECFDDELVLPEIDEKRTQKMSLGFTKRMSGMFNSIKDALPSFEDDPELDQDAKEKSLLSSMLSNSPLSPSVETSPNRERIGNNNRDGKFQYLKKGQFEFVPEHNEKSELEATLDFHIQHLAQSMADEKISSEPERNFWKRSLKNRINTNEEEMEPKISPLLIGLLFLNLKNIFPEDDMMNYLDKELVNQFCCNTLGNNMEQTIDFYIDQWTKPESMVNYINKLRAWLENDIDLVWPHEIIIHEHDDVTGEHINITSEKFNGENITGDIGGIPKSKLFKHILNITQDQNYNEQIIVEIFEVIVARLLCVDIETNI